MSALAVTTEQHAVRWFAAAPLWSSLLGGEPAEAYVPVGRHVVHAESISSFAGLNLRPWAGSQGPSTRKP